MQLFAIIATSTKDEERMTGAKQRAIVELFLTQQIAALQVQTYLEIYDQYYAAHRERAMAKRKSLKHTSSSSVRVLRICAQINEELQLVQKFIVLARLIEFARLSGSEVEGQEREFIVTVADSFYISRDELDALLFFVGETSLRDALSPFPGLLLQIIPCGDASLRGEEGRILFRDHLEGVIFVHHVARAGLYLLRYSGTQTLILGGQPILAEQLYVLSNGSSIRGATVSPIFYADIVAAFAPEGLRDQIHFQAKEVSFSFPGGKMGLNGVSFHHFGGQLVGIMGSSGAGKSTLLNVLNGNSIPAEGAVLINGTDIYKESLSVRGIIGFVSQDDLLIEELTVFQNLYYSAKLSLSGLSEDKLNELVDETLISLGLYEVRHLPVGNPLDKRISGGQRKRLNIALELIRQPSILFLDEPTSGLSSRDSESLMLLLKDLALKGKLVYVVIHQPSSDIFKMFGAIVLLDTGGYLIYEGDPVESIEYFQAQGQHVGVSERECVACGNVNPEQLFNIVENPVVDEYGNTTQHRRVQPEEWAARFEASRQPDEEPSSAPPPVESIPRAPRPPGWFRQLKVFIMRDALAKVANKQYMAISLLETPVLAAILAYIIRFYEAGKPGAVYTLMENTNLPVYLFMAVIVAFFIGLSGSAEDIIKDRKILKREAFLNLSWGAYLAAKMTNVVILSLYQSLLFTLIGNAILGIPGMFFHYWLVLFVTWLSAGVLGLLISDSFKTVVTIYILIPFLVIPQIILSGIIVRFDKLNPAVSDPETVPIYGEFIVARWAYEALAVHQFKENAYQKPLYPYEQTMSLADYKKNFWLKDLSLRVDRLVRNASPEEAALDWRLVCNELVDDVDPIRGSGISIDRLKLNPRQLPDPELLANVGRHIDQLETFYNRLYNSASRQRDSVLRIMQGSAPEDRISFIELKQANFSTSLSHFARQTDAVERIVQCDDRLLQRYDPIFQLPPYRNLKAHFYAPYKRLGDSYLDTYWVNVGVLVLSVLLTYFLLYFRVLKRLLDWMNELF